MTGAPRPGVAPPGGTEPDALPPWHAIDSESAARVLGTDPHQGLTPAEAAQRLIRYGPNELQEHRPVSALAVFAAQFKNVLTWLLIVAAGLSVVLGHGTEAVVITGIVALSALLGFVQEYRAERSLEALRALAAPAARVVRAGREAVVPARELVPGDLLLLHDGDRAPADARLVDAVSLALDESALTGESLPQEKRADVLVPPEAQVADRVNMVHAGCAVVRGRGRALVVATGMATEFGKIAGLLQAVEPAKTPFQANLDRLGRVLAQLSLAVVVLIAVLGVARGQPLFEMFLFGIALAVAAVPEALPAVVTTSLAIGVQRMLRRNVLVRRLPAVETLGSVSVICSDKTGTLTRGEMTVRRVYAGGAAFTVEGSGYAPEGALVPDDGAAPAGEALRTLLRAAALASDATLMQRDGRWEVNGDPTEGALVVAAAKAGLDKAQLDSECPRVHEVPFSAEAKRMTTWHRLGGATVAYVKGAPEVIIPACTAELAQDGERALDAARRAQLLEVATGMARNALRVIAVAQKQDAGFDQADDGLTFLGLLGMMDPPRPEARTAIERCLTAGIRPVMITGDHRVTAEAVARELRLPRGGVLDGPALDALTDDQLVERAAEVNVYARVNPAHKLRIVQALQAQGQFVAMTGDGVNDAPALKRADIGIAMGITGTDVTKEAAAMTLLDDNFASLVAAVEEGRAIFDNVKKYLMYLLSSNLGEIGLMAAAVLAGLPLPLSALQILYVNLLTDGLPALALAADPHAPGLMQRPPRDPRTGIFTRPVVVLMAAGGLWSAACNLGLFVWALGSGHSVEMAMALVFSALVLIQFLKAYSYRSDRESVLVRPLANPWLNASIVAEVLLLAAVIYLPAFQDAFGTYPFGANDWAALLLVAVTVVPVLEACKWAVRRGWFGPAG